MSQEAQRDEPGSCCRRLSALPRAVLLLPQKKGKSEAPGCSLSAHPTPLALSLLSPLHAPRPTALPALLLPRNRLCFLPAVALPSPPRLIPGAAALPGQLHPHLQGCTRTGSPGTGQGSGAPQLCAPGQRYNFPVPQFLHRREGRVTPA